MRAVQLFGVRDLRLGSVPDPQPKAGEVLLKVQAVGVCGSDLHYYLEGGIGSSTVQEPFILGHEFAAEVVERGALPAGTLVAVDPNRSCGRCEWCQKGHPNLCPNVQFSGVPPYPGALAEYITARPEQIIPLPDGMDAATGALLEPLGIAIHALDLARLRPMESVAILGAGPIGLLLLQVAQHCGAGEIVVIDPLLYRQQVASNLGASAVGGSPATVLEHTHGRGVDVVLEATNSPLGPQHAAEAVCIGGRLVLVGIPEGDQFSLSAGLVRRKGLSIKLSRRMGHVYPRAIRMAQQGKVNPHAVVSHNFGLAQTPEAFTLQASYQEPALKSMVYPWGKDKR
jgi:L-iditol 2-dehydrogenase